MPPVVKRDYPTAECAPLQLQRKRPCSVVQENANTRKGPIEADHKIVPEDPVKVGNLQLHERAIHAQKGKRIERPLPVRGKELHNSFGWVSQYPPIGPVGSTLNGLNVRQMRAV